MALGINCKMYRNTGTYGSPTWDEVPGVGDFQVSPNWDTAEVVIRASRVKMAEPTTLALEITGKFYVDNTASTDYLAFDDAHIAGTALDLMILDGASDVNVSRGFRGYFKVHNWAEDQGPNGVLWRDFTLVPSVPTDGNYVKRAVVTAGAPVFTAIT